MVFNDFFMCERNVYGECKLWRKKFKFGTILKVEHIGMKLKVEHIGTKLKMEQKIFFLQSWNETF